MKKKTYQKTKNKPGGLSSRNQKGLTILVAVGVFFVSMYMFRCFLTKVCGVIAIDTLVRSKYTLLMPKGALDVEVANTRASRELGLSGRFQMKDGEGMLFIFDTPGRYGFWMKDMEFPLDIVWINENGIVVSIERGLTKETYPKAFINQADATYVIEMKAGESEKQGLYIGSRVKITN